MLLLLSVPYRLDELTLTPTLIKSNWLEGKLVITVFSRCKLPADNPCILAVTRLSDKWEKTFIMCIGLIDYVCT